jgi:localization factor PodJL
MVRSLQERFDAVSTGFAPEGLEERLGLLQSLNLTAAEPVQQALTETLTHVRGLRGEAAIIAERAAKAALRDMPLTSAVDVDGVREGFAELKALHAGAERRTQATLKAIQAALESLATRLPPGDARPESASSWDSEAVRLDTAVRKLRAVAGTRSADPATQETADAAAEIEEVLLDPSTPRSLPTSSGPSFATPADGEPGSVRASFIAAARRAAQPSGEGAPPDAETEGANAGPATGHTLLERIRQTFDGHRRPLLLGLALLSVAAGSAPVGSGPGEMSKAALKMREASAAPAATDASSREPV